MTNNCLQYILCPSKFYEQTVRRAFHRPSALGALF